MKRKDEKALDKAMMVTDKGMEQVCGVQQRLMLMYEDSEDEDRSESISESQS